MIDNFVAKFTSKEIMYEKIGDSYYLIDKAITNINFPYPLVFKGLCLGELRKDKFYPSLALLDVLAKFSNEKVYVKDIGEMDFVYGKNLRKRHIVKVEGSTKKGFLKLIMNMKNECLGYGKVVNDFSSEGVVIRNVLDKGDYLRREID
ncbi:hypothetical protein D6777_03135 [Candidatus Woesearchaeota archaeon]|nr:MAG: hypothetical protein D6777_03135 [Candidatus Woesearchaeota archaeon]